jgi:arylsulfatase A-like enzyme
MPARRDLQSGRLSFLHRGWGPLEPFDNSFPEIMKKNNVYSHLISDHYHYFEDGGSTYHTRYNSFDFIRGQERDPWKPMIEPPIERFKEMYHEFQMKKIEATEPKYAYPVNREYIKQEKDFPSVKCFESGLDFLKKHKGAKKLVSSN